MGRDVITVKHKGDFSKTEKFLKKSLDRAYLKELNTFGEMGVRALSSSTPRKTGKTAGSWSYTIEQNADFVRIVWTNSNIQNGVNIALILDSGHGTGRGVWIEGLHYIDPAMKPVFEQIANNAWKGVVE